MAISIHRVESPNVPQYFLDRGIEVAFKITSFDGSVLYIGSDSAAAKIAALLSAQDREVNGESGVE